MATINYSLICNVSHNRHYYSVHWSLCFFGNGRRVRSITGSLFILSLFGFPTSMQLCNSEPHWKKQSILNSQQSEKQNKFHCLKKSNNILLERHERTRDIFPRLEFKLCVQVTTTPQYQCSNHLIAKEWISHTDFP